MDRDCTELVYCFGKHDHFNNINSFNSWAKTILAFITEIEQKILKFAWNYKRIQTVKAIMRKKKPTKLKAVCFKI